MRRRLVRLLPWKRSSRSFRSFSQPACRKQSTRCSNSQSFRSSSRKGSSSLDSKTSSSSSSSSSMHRKGKDFLGSLPPSQLQVIGILGWHVHVVVVTKEDVISSYPLFARYKPNPFILPAHLRLLPSHRLFYELMSSWLWVKIRMTAMAPPHPLVAENWVRSVWMLLTLGVSKLCLKEWLTMASAKVIGLNDGIGFVSSKKRMPWGNTLFVYGACTQILYQGNALSRVSLPVLFVSTSHVKKKVHKSTIASWLCSIITHAYRSSTDLKCKADKLNAHLVMFADVR